MTDPTIPNSPRGRVISSGSRYLVFAGLVAPLVLVIGSMLAASTWPGYSHRTRNLSDLGGTEAPYPIVQNATFVVFGLLVVAFAAGLRRSLRGGRGAGAAPWLVGYFGAMAVVQSSAPCTPGCAEGTPADVVHGLAATTGFLAFGVATLLLWRRTRAEPGRRRYAVYSAATGIVTIGSLGAWFVAGAVDPDGLHAGALQRLMVAAMLLWLGVTAARLVGLSREEPSARS